MCVHVCLLACAGTFVPQCKYRSHRTTWWSRFSFSTSMWRTKAQNWGCQAVKARTFPAEELNHHTIIFNLPFSRWLMMNCVQSYTIRKCGCLRNVYLNHLSRFSTDYLFSWVSWVLYISEILTYQKYSLKRFKLLCIIPLDYWHL